MYPFACEFVGDIRFPQGTDKPRCSMGVFHGHMMFEYLAFVIKPLYHEYPGSAIKLGIRKPVSLDRA